MNKTYLIAGLRGNGTHIALALVCMGVRRIILFEKDIIEPSNLTRQVLYSLDDIGRSKAIVAHEILRRYSYRTEIITYGRDILDIKEEFENAVKESDFIFNCVDHYQTRFYVSTAALKYGKPMITLGTDASSGLKGAIFFQKPKGKPCFGCVYLYGLGGNPPEDWLRKYSALHEGPYDKEIVRKSDETLLNVQGGQHT